MPVLFIRKNLQAINDIIKKEYSNNTPFDFTKGINSLKEVENSDISKLSVEKKHDLQKLLNGLLATLTTPKALPDLYVSQLAGKDWFALLDATANEIKDIQEILK